MVKDQNLSLYYILGKLKTIDKKMDELLLIVKAKKVEISIKTPPKMFIQGMGEVKNFSGLDRVKKDK